MKGQCGDEKPDWAKGSFHITLENSYLETVVTTGMYFDDTRSKAEEEIERRRKGTVGVKDAWIKSKPIAEYWECGNNDYQKIGYFLYQTLKRPDYQYESVEVTSDYPFSARVFVPGMVQLHKGSTAKGVMFIVGEIALVGSVVAFEGLRSSYESKINSTKSASDKQFYIDKADNMQNLRNGFVAGAVALYAWNVIDGIVAKGKKHVLIGNTNIRVAPYIAPEASGFALAVNF